MSRRWVYKVNAELEKQGVIFLDMDSALRDHEELVREYFATIIPPNDNKLAALNSAVWSGGSFVYVPPGVHVEMPLQAYFRINTESMGQFERTLIIADEGSYVHYVEGCTAPTYSSSSPRLGGGRADRQARRPDPLHDRAELVQQRVQPRDQARDWPRPTRLSSGSTAQPRLQADHEVPERVPDGRACHGEILSIAFAGKDQHQDAGGKVIHAAPNTTSNILAESICKDGGPAALRAGCWKIAKALYRSRWCAMRSCSTSTAAPIRTPPSGSPRTTSTSATKRRCPRSARTSSSLMSHGIPEDEAGKLIVNGFIEPITKELPMEYAVEMNRLIELQMEGSIG